MNKRKSQVLSGVLAAALLMGNTMPVFASDISVDSDTVTGYTPAEFFVDEDVLGGGVVVTIPASLELSQNQSGNFVANDVVSAYGNMNPSKLLSISTSNEITYVNQDDEEITATAAVTFGMDGIEDWTAEQTKNSITKLDKRKINVTVAQEDIKYIGDYTSTVYFDISMAALTSFFNLSASDIEVTVVGLADGVSKCNLVFPSTCNGLPVTTITSNAFADNTKIASITIPNSVTNIGDAAFSGCSNLTSVTYNDKEYNSITSLSIDLEAAGVTVGTDAFTNTGLLDDAVLGAMFTWKTYDTYAVVDRLAQSTTETNIIIPSTYNGLPVTQIGVSSLNSQGVRFSSIDMISLVIPDSVTSLYDYSFESCTSLCTVKLSNNLKSISQGAFKGCKSLTSIEIPDSVTSFGSEAFQNCTSLSEVIYKGTTYTSRGKLIAALNANNVRVGTYGVFDSTALAE